MDAPLTIPDIFSEMHELGVYIVKQDGVWKVTQPVNKDNMTRYDRLCMCLRVRRAEVLALPMFQEGATQPEPAPAPEPQAEFDGEHCDECRAMVYVTTREIQQMCRMQQCPYTAAERQRRKKWAQQREAKS